MDEDIVVGTRVRAKRAMMGFPIGSIGFVYETYYIGKDFGVSIIFSNGSYSGFSEAEFGFLEFLDIDPRYSMYKFVNVGKLWDDYKSGHWNFGE